MLCLVATLVFVLMLATSTNGAQRALGPNWKRLRRLVWFAVPLSLAHALVSAGWSRWPSPSSSTAPRVGAPPARRSQVALVGAGTLVSAVIYLVF